MKHSKTPQSTKRLLFFVTEDWYFCSHRLELAIKAKEDGFDVFVMCNVKKHEGMITSFGIKVIPISIKRNSINLFQNILDFIHIFKIIRKINPDILHNVAQKPVIFGSLAARVCGIPKTVNALGGLGFVFTSNSLRTRIIRYVLKNLYKLLLKSDKVILIVQNREDFSYFKNSIGLRGSNVVMFKGAGVDLTKFAFCEMPDEPPTRVVLISRMLKDKGIQDFLDASQLVSNSKNRISFELIGDIDPMNPNSFSCRELKLLSKRFNVKWAGPSADIPLELSKAHIVVLPSYYREGIPKSLIEATAVGRPIITTDTPGCSETVINGKNGYTIPIKDPQALAEKISLLSQSPVLQRKMGLESRRLAERRFCSKRIISQTLELYEK